MKCIPTWNPKPPFINGCFNWMIPNLYIGNGCCAQHLFINGCLGFQADICTCINLQLWKRNFTSETVVRFTPTINKPLVPSLQTVLTRQKQRKWLGWIRGISIRKMPGSSSVFDHDKTEVFTSPLKVLQRFPMLPGFSSRIKPLPLRHTGHTVAILVAFKSSGTVLLQVIF